MKICYVCKIEKDLEHFSPSQLKSADYICKQCVKLKNKEWYAKNKLLVKQKSKEHYHSNIVEEKQKRKQRRELNKETIKQTNKQYRESHKTEYNIYRNQYDKERKIKDPNYKLRKVLRHRIYLALKGNKKIQSSVKLLGCSTEDAITYIQSKWKQGMTWDNWTNKGWHLDHIKPLSKFDLTNLEQLKEACHYTNLQPLWAVDNIQKGNR